MRQDEEQRRGGIFAADNYDEKKASESMRMAIDHVMSRIHIELN